MARSIRCVTYNCRGWNSGKISISDFIDSYDFEHWLFSDNLRILNDFHPNFSCVAVSGMDSNVIVWPPIQHKLCTFAKVFRYVICFICNWLSSMNVQE